MISTVKYPLYITPNSRPVIFDMRSSVSTTTHPELIMRATLYVRRGNVYSAVALKYQQKYPGQTYFRFNFAKNLQAYLSYDLFENFGSNNKLETPCPNSCVDYYVIFHELYNNNSGLLAVFDGAKTSVHKAGNSCIQHQQAPDMTLDVWTIFNTTLQPSQYITQLPATPGGSVITGATVTKTAISSK